MSRFQPTPRRDLAKCAAMARKLNAARHMGAHVAEGTLMFESNEIVLRRTAEQSFTVGRLALEEGRVYFLVASKFAPHYYVVVATGEAYQCSAFDERAAEMCIEKVRVFLSTLVVA